MPFRRVLFRSEEHTSELQSHDNLVCRLLLEKKQHSDPDQVVLFTDLGNPTHHRIERPTPPTACPDRSVSCRGGTTGGSVFFFFFLRIRRPRISPLFPYPALFR